MAKSVEKLTKKRKICEANLKTTQRMYDELRGAKDAALRTGREPCTVAVDYLLSGVNEKHKELHNKIDKLARKIVTAELDNVVECVEEEFNQMEEEEQNANIDNSDNEEESDDEEE